MGKPKLVPFFHKRWTTLRAAGEKYQSEAVAMFAHLTHPSSLFDIAVSLNSLRSNSKYAISGSKLSFWALSNANHLFGELCKTVIDRLHTIGDAVKRLVEFEELIRVLRKEESDLFSRKKNLLEEDQQILSESIHESEVLLSSIPQNLQTPESVDTLMNDVFNCYFGTIFGVNSEWCAATLPSSDPWISHVRQQMQLQL